MSLVNRTFELIASAPRAALEDALGLAALSVFVIGLFSLPGFV